MRSLECGLAEEHAVVRDDAHGVPVYPGEGGHQRRAVLRLELADAAAVDQTIDHRVHVVRGVDVDGDHVVQRARFVGFARREDLPDRLARCRERAHDIPEDLEGVLVVLGEVIDHPAAARVHLSPTELLRRDHLSDRGLHQRRTTEEDRALAAHDDRLVAHRRYVGATRGARSEHRGELRDALGRHPCLVEEDATEVVAVGEDLVLLGEERPAGIHQVEARQTVLTCDLLSPQMLLDRHREVGAALHGRIVADDHHVPAVHQSDAGDHSGARSFAVVEPVRREWRHLEERTPLVEKSVDALARQELPPGDMALTRGLRATECRGGESLVQLLGEGLLGCGHRGVLLDTFRRSHGAGAAHDPSVSVH